MKKKIVVVISIICVCAIVFGIYWKATEFSRYRNRRIEEIRHGDFGYVSDEMMSDEVFQEFLVTYVQELYQNGRCERLANILNDMEYYDINSYLVEDTINECINSYGNIDNALHLFHEIKIRVESYNNVLDLNKNTGVIAEYISANGTNPISFEKGSGYYAKEKDDSSYERIGIQGSRLYDAVDVLHFGDFRYIHEYGVHLSRVTYKEEEYSRENYYFRGEHIEYRPETDECVWSGDYVFCFSAYGTLLDYAKLT